MKTIPQLHYEDVGTGSPVVLLHGFMASSRYWHKVTEKLATKHRVIAIDLLGFGKSPKPACSKYDYDAQMKSIEATLEAAAITEPFTLIGHSMGSLLSLRYAREHPAQVKKLLLTNMPVLLNPSDARDEIFGTNFFYRIGLKPGLHMIIWPIFRAATYLRLIPQKIAEGAVSRRSYMFQSTGISRLRSMRNVIFAAGIEADLYALRMKTVMLSGLQDRQRYMQNIATLKPRTNILTSNVPGGHHLPLTQPELIYDLV